MIGSSLRFVAVAVACAGVAQIAYAAEPQARATSEIKGSAESTESPAGSVITESDPATKRASLEIAAYSDSDHVSVFTPSISASIENVTTGASLRGRYLVDVVSGASVDIVSTASRQWREVRQAGSLSGEYKPRDFGVSIAGSASREPDYLSYGASIGITKDFDEKNTTLSFGYGFSHDVVGRSSTPFSVFSREIQRGSFNGGISQVLSRASVLSLSLDVVVENGDSSKPYRYIPMFSSDVAPSVPRGASIEWVTQHRLPERPLEQLPLSRRRFALTTRWAYRFEASTLRLEERLYDDTWGLAAATTDGRWILDLGRRFAIGPHARFHTQSAVSFWQRAYVSGPAPGWDLPEYRTGDRELGALWTFTGGGGVKWYLGAHDPTDWSIAFQGDAMYTSYLDALYLTERTAFLGVFTFEGRLIRTHVRAALLVILALVACGDPVHDNRVDALGPEQAGIPQGPRHRAGQPCLACHDGSGPGSPKMSIGGTVYAVKGESAPMAGVNVHLVDARGSTWDTTTNDVGNFHVRFEDWAPSAPIHVAISFGDAEVKMDTHIGRDGSCASCHFDPPGPASPGRVYFALDAEDLPGASP